ncbi:MAG: epoxyqueuosine reductase [Clostridia bacterium]|nr:epoxyqueuosine reductase [Clostridia bacterium]
MTALEVKQRAFSLGADLCGVASVDRFDEAPEGYHPLDVMPSCHSVISFACRFPVGTLRCASHVPYTRVRNTITPRMDMIALEMCLYLEQQGYASAPVPTNESQWDARTGRWRSIISQKHAAQAAGLGRIGRHSLLITPEYGSMVWLGAVLTEAALQPDALLPDICTNCGLCVAACPVDALKGQEMAQQACWDHAFGDDQETQAWCIRCHACRDVCPFNLGQKNGGMK